MHYTYRVLRYSQDRKPDSHFHEDYEIHLALNNEGAFFVRERSYPLRYGTAFIVGQFEIHRCFCSGNSNYDRYIIQFSRSLLTHMSTRQTDLTYVFDNAPLRISVPDELLSKILSSLSYFIRPATNDFCEDIQRNNYFERIILLFAKIIQSNRNTPALEIKSSERVEEILQYLHSHYHENLSLDTLSATFFMSKSRLNLIFREATAFSIGDYIITYRIQKACILLQKGLRVKDVGKMVGFQESPHFIRTFKKRIGVSPGDFAKHNQ